MNKNFGVTTMHIFDVDNMTARERSMFELKPSKNGWNTSITSWDSAQSALNEAEMFVTMLMARLIGSHDHLEIKVFNARPLTLQDGLTYHEAMIYGVRDGRMESFGRVETVVGPESAVDMWEDAENEQWFI